MKANHTALATAQGVAEAAQQAIKKQDKAIEDKKVEIKDKEDAITVALKTHVDNYGEKPLANDDRYDDEITKANKAGDTDAVADWNKKKTDFEAIKKLDGELKKLQGNDEKGKEGLRQLILGKNDLVTDKDIAVAAANDAEKTYNASEKNGFRQRWICRIQKTSWTKKRTF